MNLNFTGKKITGLLSIIPQNEVTFEDEMKNYNFPLKNSLKLKKIMGYDKHRMVDDSTCVSDLCVFGLEYLFENRLLDKDEIDALILVTQTPDYHLPPTSYVIQGRLELKQDILCLDINQGCAGFLVGLIEAFNLLENEAFKKVVLLNADVLSRKVSKQDRNSYPLGGDAASVTIVERGDKEKNIYANLKVDGTRHDVLIIPAGGMRLPSTNETRELEWDEEHNARSKEHLRMDGRGVFNFVQVEVPPLIEGLIKFSGITKDKIDYYMFHQPNKFMLQKLANKMEIPYEKMPSNIVENFGNSSGVTIPLNITYNLGDKLENKAYTLCLAGFGVGLTWSSMIIELGQVEFCKMIEFDR